MFIAAPHCVSINTDTIARGASNRKADFGQWLARAGERR
jgi:hypothetical protein